GRGMVEFKKGMRGIEDAIDSAVTAKPRTTSTYNEIDDREEVSAPRFEPPPAEPRAEAGAHAAGTSAVGLSRAAASSISEQRAETTAEPRTEAVSSTAPQSATQTEPTQSA